jgi:hypothetical protein
MTTTTNLAIKAPTKLSREEAVELLIKGCEKYLNETYDGSLDRRGLIMELRYNVAPKGMAAIFDWFTGVLDTDFDDLLILLMVAWTEAAGDDFDWKTNFTTLNNL